MRKGKPVAGAARKLRPIKLLLPTGAIRTCGIATSVAASLPVGVSGSVCKHVASVSMEGAAAGAELADEVSTPIKPLVRRNAPAGAASAAVVIKPSAGNAVWTALDVVPPVKALPVVAGLADDVRKAATSS